MTAPRRIGVLGGMGPEATVLLMQRLIAAVPARDDADHVPLLVDSNTRVPSTRREKTQRRYLPRWRSGSKRWVPKH